MLTGNKAQGAVIIIAVLLIPMVLALSSLAIDYNYHSATRQLVNHIAEHAVHSGSMAAKQQSDSKVIMLVKGIATSMLKQHDLIYRNMLVEIKKPANKQKSIVLSFTIKSSYLLQLGKWQTINAYAIAHTNTETNEIAVHSYY